jgi:hypothetical protein
VIRRIDGITGLIVPSVGALDDLSRWNLVLYHDRLSEWPLVSPRDARVVGSLDFPGSTDEG